MSESQMILQPTIQWKIRDISGYCKVKGPQFAFLGATWKLKFIYCSSSDGDKSFITLKRCGECIEVGDIQVSTSVCPHSNFKSSVSVSVSSHYECIIWEKRDRDIPKPYGYANAVNILLYLKDPYYFDVDFTLQTTSMWQNYKEGTEQAGVIAISPCIASMCHDLGDMFNNHLMSDVILKCGGQKIYAHNCILSARSSVFAAMFRIDMKESIMDSIVIEDVEPAILKQMIRYMYSGDILDLTAENVYNLYMASDMYGVGALKMKCAIFMIDNAAVASQAVDEAGVKRNVLSYFSKIEAVFKTEEWKKLSETDSKFVQKALKFFVNECS